MSRYLSLDLEQGRLYLASVVVKGSAVQVEKALTLPNISALTGATSAELGRQLKDALKDAGIAPAPLLISVGREKMVLKEVKYPASVPAAEEPALVRFQVSKELTEGGDGVVVDYFVLPTPDPDGQRRALAFAIRKDALSPWRSVCLAAGLKLAGVTPRPFGIAASLVRAIKDGAVLPPESANAPIAVLVRGDKWGELVILRGGQVAFARSLTGASLASEATMVGELRRNLAVFSGPSQQNQVQAIYVAEGDVPGGWTGRVKGGFQVPVQSFDPIAGIDVAVPPETRGSFAGLVGLAALRRSPELPVNFVSPREPVAASDPNKRMLAWIGIAAAVLLIGGLLFGHFVVEQKADLHAASQKQKNDLEEDIKKLDDVAKRVKAVKDWEDKRINWLDEIYDLSARFPDTASTEVVQLIASPFDPGKNSKLKHVALMEVKVVTTPATVGAVDGLIRNMSHDRHYSVGAKQSGGTSGPSGPFANNRKNQQFVFKAQIERREPNQYLEKLSAQAPSEIGKPPRRDGKKPSVGAVGGVGPFGGEQ